MRDCIYIDDLTSSEYWEVLATIATLGAAKSTLTISNAALKTISLFEVQAQHHEKRSDQVYSQYLVADTQVYDWIILRDQYTSLLTIKPQLEPNWVLIASPENDGVMREMLAISFSSRHSMIAPPSFSIMMPLYNHQDFVANAMESVINQRYSNWELIVVDDGSTDNSAAIVEHYCQRDLRIKLFQKTNGGTASALNVAVQHCQNDWLGWLSTDDIYYPNKLALHTLLIYLSDAKPSFQFSHFKQFSDKTSVYQPYRIGPPGMINQQLAQVLMAAGNYVVGITAIIHQTLLDQAGEFDSRLLYTQDYDMWCRLAALSAPLLLPVATAASRLGDHQESQRNIEEHKKEVASTFNRYLQNLPPASNREGVYQQVVVLLTAALNPKSTLCGLEQGSQYCLTALRLIRPYVRSLADVQHFKRFFFQSYSVFPLGQPAQILLSDFFNRLFVYEQA